MIKHENECVDCGLPCLGDSCKYKNVRRLYCDCCGEETDELYKNYDGDELCHKCMSDSTLRELKTMVLHCDECGEETDTLYEFDTGDYLCEECAIEKIFNRLEVIR